MKRFWLNKCFCIISLIWPLSLYGLRFDIPHFHAYIYLSTITVVLAWWHNFKVSNIPLPLYLHQLIISVVLVQSQGQWGQTLYIMTFVLAWYNFKVSDILHHAYLYQFVMSFVLVRYNFQVSDVKHSILWPLSLHGTISRSVAYLRQFIMSFVLVWYNLKVSNIPHSFYCSKSLQKCNTFFFFL